MIFRKSKSEFIALLDDDPRRIEAMYMQLSLVFAQYTVKEFKSAPRMNQWLGTNLKQCALISLDHDLVPLEGGAADDPGTGRDVADFIASRKPACPVIVHSTNSPAAAGMMFALEDAGWTVKRVPPFNDLEWIDTLWIATVRMVLDKD